MNHSESSKQISLNEKAFAGLFCGACEEESRRNPSTGKWRLVEIVSHSGVEEREDFHANVKLTLEIPTGQLPPAGRNMHPESGMMCAGIFKPARVPVCTSGKY